MPGSNPWPGEGSGKAFWSRLEASLAPLDREPTLSPGAHAVLVPLIEGPGGPWVLFTRRAAHLSAHPGEVSYPGGGVERADDDAAEAALREAREEVGLDPDGVELLGVAADVETLRGRHLRAVVGRVDPDATLHAPRTPEEVAERLVVALPALAQGRGRLPDASDKRIAPPARFGTPYPVRGYEARTLTEGSHREEVIHYWHLDEDTTVWGLTGAVTARLLSRAVDWEPPSAPRTVEPGDVEP